MGEKKQDEQEAGSAKSLSSSIKEQLSRELQQRSGSEAAAPAAAARPRVKAARKRPARGPVLKLTVGGIFRGFRRRAIMAFCQELSLLLECGMPLLKALRSLQARWDNPGFARMIGEIADSVENGRMLSQALEEHKHVFGSSLISMLRAGEKSGKLGQMLARVAEHGEHISAFKERIVGMMIYPILILVAAGGVIALVLNLLGKLEEFFGEFMEAGLPGPMQFLVNVGRLASGWGFWVTCVIVLVGVIVLWIVAMRIYAFRLLRDRILMRLPMVRHFVKQSALVNFSRVFSTLLHSGVPLPEALDAAHDAAQNEVVRLTIERVEEAVERGERITPSLRHGHVFPTVTYELSDVGEETGTLDRVFQRLADVYENKQRTELDMLGKLIQPAIVLCMAIIVGFIVYAFLATYLQLFQSLGA